MSFGDVFRSTQHQVALPQKDQGRQKSLLDCFFCQPDARANITCLPTCHSEDNPIKYAPITSGAYLISRLQGTY